MMAKSLKQEELVEIAVADFLSVEISNPKDYWLEINPAITEAEATYRREKELEMKIRQEVLRRLQTY